MTTTELQHIPYDELVPSEDNIRHVLNGDLEGLMRSIASGDPKNPTLHQPLTVSPEGGKFRIIAGHRRHAAIGMGRDRKLIDKNWAPPCFVQEYGDTDRRIAMVVENTQREGLNPLDEAVAYAQLRDEFGLTQKEIAERVGFSPAYVSSRIKSGRLAPSVVAAIRAEQVDFNQALRLADLERGDQDRFMEAWDNTDIPAFKIQQYVQRVKAQKILEKASREAVRAGFTTFYQGSDNDVNEYVPEGKIAEVRHVEGVSELEEVPADVEFLMLKVNFSNEVSYYPIRFAEMDETDEAVQSGEAAPNLRRERQRHQMNTIIDLAGTRPGMQRVDGMLAQMTIRSLSPASATTLCRILGVEVKEINGWDDPIESLIEEAGTDKRALATIGVLAGLLHAHPDARDAYLLELVEDYEPMEIEAEEDPF